MLYFRKVVAVIALAVFLKVLDIHFFRLFYLMNPPVIPWMFLNLSDIIKRRSK